MNNTFFRDAPPVKLFFLAAIPGAVSMLASALYQLLDGVFVGQFLGQTAFSALNLAMPFVIINFALADLIGVGSAVPISIHLGRKEEDTANNIFSCACLMIVTTGAVVGAILFFAAPLLIGLMGAEGEFASMAVAYLRVYALCSPVTTIVFAMDNYLRICGKVRTSMCLNIIMSVLSGVLEFVFLFVFRWGIWAAALATCLGMMVCAVAALAFFCRGKLQLPPAKEGQRRHGANHHTQAGGQGRRPDAPAENKEEHKLQHAAEHGHDDIEAHAGSHLAADAQVVIHGKNDGGDRRAQGIYPQVSHRHAGKLPFRPHQADEQRRSEKQNCAHHGAGGHNHQTGAGENIVCRVLLFAAQVNGNGNGGANADQVSQGKVDDDKGHGQIQGRKGGLPQKLAHKYPVQQLVKGRGQHTDRPGDGRQEKQLHRRGVTEKRVIHISILSLLSMSFAGSPPEGIRHSTQRRQ